jgi:uncharacterized protein YheU (UPF0270 family)
VSHKEKSYLCFMPMVEEAIVYLLLRHNCVVVPAFGGFVAKSSGSTIDFSTGVISPARKTILFNKQLINNDGLLISHLSLTTDWEYGAAEQFLQEKVKEWQERLKQGERVVIDNIGQLYLDAERNINFEQDRFFNLMLESYGLTQVRFVSEADVQLAQELHLTELETKEEAPAISIMEAAEISDTEILEKENAPILSLSEKNHNRKLWKYVAAAALLPFAFYTYWIPVETRVLESGMISFNDFNPTYQAGNGVYQQKSIVFSTLSSEKEISLQESIAKLPEGTDVFYYKYDENTMIPVKTEKKELELSEIKSAPVEINSAIEESKPTKVATPETPKLKTAYKNFHYITGCFSDRANAEAMVAKLKERGLDGQILDVKNGMTRVSAGSAASEAEFARMQSKVLAVGYKGWKLD